MWGVVNIFTIIDDETKPRRTSLTPIAFNKTPDLYATSKMTLHSNSRSNGQNGKVHRLGKR